MVTPDNGPNQHWSLDFVHDQMHDGRKFRIVEELRKRAVTINCDATTKN